LVEDSEIGIETITEIINETYRESFSDRSEIVPTDMEEEMAEEALRFTHPESEHGELKHPPKRLRPAMFRWVGKEILDEDPEWDRIVDVPEEWNGEDLSGVSSWEQVHDSEADVDPLEVYEQEIDEVSIAVEILHNYTLAHDDPIDGDETRRGVPVSWVEIKDKAVEEYDMDEADAAQLGKDLSVNLGDLMHDLPYSIISSSNLTDEKITEMVSTFADGSMRIAMGQQRDILMEYLNQKDVLNEESRSALAEDLFGSGPARNGYIDMSDKKTGDLYATSAALGAIAADANENVLRLESGEEVVHSNVESSQDIVEQLEDLETDTSRLEADVYMASDLEEAYQVLQEADEEYDVQADIIDEKDEIASYARAAALSFQITDDVNELVNGAEHGTDSDKPEKQPTDVLNGKTTLTYMTALKSIENQMEQLEEEIEERVEEEDYGTLGPLKDRKRQLEHDRIMIDRLYGNQDASSDEVMDVSERVLDNSSAQEVYETCSRFVNQALERAGVDDGELRGLAEYMHERDF
jgi:geranylgeranyl pyrophosphate synthase